MEDAGGMEDQHAASFDGSRSNKLARKAESARQARLRHKAYVTDLQEQVGALQARVRSLEAQCAPEHTAMHVVCELQSALTAEQHAQLTSWLTVAQGENHVLKRAAAGAAAAAATAAAAAASQPIAIGNGERSASPMESDDDTFGMSRSWDDIEGARSILYLNSPQNSWNHPPNAIPPWNFRLSSSAASSSAPSTFHISFGGSTAAS